MSILLCWSIVMFAVDLAIVIGEPWAAETDASPAINNILFIISLAKLAGRSW